MKVIPSIDILNGRCVRLKKGNFKLKKIYSLSPFAMAKRFKSQGVQMLHIVDLDAAKTGEPKNFALIKTIIQKVNVPVQIGGGIRSTQAAKLLLDAGANKIVIGTKAVLDLNFLKLLLAEFGSKKIVVALEAKQNKLAIFGWQKITTLNIIDFAKKLQKIGITEILFTDINCDGTLTQPNYKTIKKLISLGLNVTASGGVADIDAIVKLKNLGVKAAIIGKALYENKIKLLEAIKIAKPISNLAKRIIPCLDIKNGHVIKGTNFKNLLDAGDPVVLAKKYSQEGADELVFLDISASMGNRQLLFDLIKKIAQKINIPFTVGGGIKTIPDIKKLLQNGADKISINTSAVKNPRLILQAAKIFGSQCVVVAIDAKKVNKSYKVFVNGGTQETNFYAIDWAKKVESLGAGEILLTSIDRDGSKTGYDLDLLKQISLAVNIPVIASGGAGTLNNIKQAFTNGQADAVLAASIFHYGKYSIREIKKYLATNNINVRL